MPSKQVSDNVFTTIIVCISIKKILGAISPFMLLFYGDDRYATSGVLDVRRQSDYVITLMAIIMRGVRHPMIDLTVAGGALYSVFSQLLTWSERESRLKCSI